MKIPGFNDDFSDMILALEGAECAYIIVGGYAMAFNGYVRATGDIDILVKPDRENAKKVMRALENFGAPLQGVYEEDFQKEGTIFQIGIPPVRIDIITKIDGLSFDEAYADRKIFSTEGLRIPYISIETIIRNKEATGREKDILDVRELKKRKTEK